MADISVSRAFGSPRIDSVSDAGFTVVANAEISRNLRLYYSVTNYLVTSGQDLDLSWLATALPLCEGRQAQVIDGYVTGQYGGEVLGMPHSLEGIANAALREIRDLRCARSNPLMDIALSTTLIVRLLGSLVQGRVPEEAKTPHAPHLHALNCNSVAFAQFAFGSNNSAGPKDRKPLSLY